MAVYVWIRIWDPGGRRKGFMCAWGDFWPKETCGPLVDVSGDPTLAKSIPHLHSVQSVLQLHICPSSLRLRYHASLIPSFSLTYLLLPLCIFYVAHMAAPRRVTHFWSSATPMLLRCERLDTKIVLGAFKGGLQSDRRPA